METEVTGAATPDQSTGTRDDYGERNGWRGDTRRGADRPAPYAVQWPPSFSVRLAASRASRLGSRSRVRRKHSAMVWRTAA
jgi:hypothetical protein